jgi:hypothetical protein
VVAFAGAFACLLPGVAHGSIVGSNDGAGVAIEGLTSKQRQALDIKKVTAIGTSVGLIVVVDFRGDIEQTLGRSNPLRRRAVAYALAALVLDPPDRPRASAFSPVGSREVLGTMGSGPVGQTVHATQTHDVGVGRERDKLTFVLFGLDLARVGRIRVVTIVPPNDQLRWPPRRTGEILVQELVRRGLAVRGRADDAEVAVPAPTVNECASVRAAGQELKRQRQDLKIEEIRAVQRITQLESDISTARRVIRDPRQSSRVKRFWYDAAIRWRAELERVKQNLIAIRKAESFFRPRKQLDAREEQACAQGPIANQG